MCIRDRFESVTYPGFLRLAAKYWRKGLEEMWRSFSKRAFVRALSRLMPEIRVEHLVPARSGVRAQAVAGDGSILDDFLIQLSDSVINVNNAPSPAATSALNVGQMVTDKLAEQLEGEGRDQPGRQAEVAGPRVRSDRWPTPRTWELASLIYSPIIKQAPNKPITYQRPGGFATRCFVTWDIYARRTSCSTCRSFAENTRRGSCLDRGFGPDGL